jgi:hypothetical protein
MWFSILTCLLVPLLGLSVVSGTGLAVSGEKQSVLIELADWDMVECSFVHSVERSRVVELYRVNSHGLVLFESRTKSFGWGLPCNEPDYSMKEIDGETWFVFEMSRPMPKLVIATDPVNDYVLRIGDKIFKLEDFGGTVEVEVKNFYRIGFDLPAWKMSLRVP